MSHTPGPWKVYEDSNGMFGVTGVVGGEKGDADLSEADARLIAAAPELLEACLYAIRAGDLHGLELKHVRAAIQKATAKQ